MKPRWKHEGLTEEGARQAEAAYGAMLTTLIMLDNKKLAESVLAAAAFEVFELPLRSKKFQKAYYEENG